MKELSAAKDARKKAEELVAQAQKRQSELEIIVRTVTVRNKELEKKLNQIYREGTGGMQPFRHQNRIAFIAVYNSSFIHFPFKGTVPRTNVNKKLHKFGRRASVAVGEADTPRDDMSVDNGSTAISFTAQDLGLSEGEAEGLPSLLTRRVPRVFLMLSSNHLIHTSLQSSTASEDRFGGDWSEVLVIGKDKLVDRIMTFFQTKKYKATNLDVQESVEILGKKRFGSVVCHSRLLPEILSANNNNFMDTLKRQNAGVPFLSTLNNIALLC